MATTDKDKRRAREIFKTLPPGKKFLYILQYYKLVIFLVVIAAAFVLYIHHHIVHHEPDPIVNVTLVGASESAEYNDSRTVFDRFMEDNGYDPDEGDIELSIMTLNTYMNQLITAQLLNGEIDLIAGDDDVLDMLQEGEALTELDMILPEDLLEDCSDSLYTAVETETGEEHVYAIKLNDGNELLQDEYYSEPVWLGIAYTSERVDMAESLMEYLLGYQQ